MLHAHGMGRRRPLGLRGGGPAAGGLRVGARGPDDAGVPGEEAQGVGESAQVPGDGERQGAAGQAGGPGEVPDEVRCQAGGAERAGDSGGDRVPVRGERATAR